MIERESMFLLGPWSFAWSLSFPSRLDYVAGCCLPILLALCATEIAFSLLVLAFDFTWLSSCTTFLISFVIPSGSRSRVCSTTLTERSYCPRLLCLSVLGLRLVLCDFVVDGGVRDTFLCAAFYFGVGFGIGCTNTD